MVLDEKYSNAIFTQEEIMVTSPAADCPDINHPTANRPAEDCLAAVCSTAECPAAIDERELSNENEKLPYVTPCKQ